MDDAAFPISNPAEHTWANAGDICIADTPAEDVVTRFTDTRLPLPVASIHSSPPPNEGSQIGLREAGPLPVVIWHANPIAMLYLVPLVVILIGSGLAAEEMLLFLRAVVDNEMNRATQNSSGGNSC